MKAHLLKLSNFGIQPCVKVGDKYQNEMQKLEDAYEESSHRLKKPRLVSLPSDSPTSPNLGPINRSPIESSVATSNPFFQKKKNLQLGHFIRLVYPFTLLRTRIGLR